MGLFDFLKTTPSRTIPAQLDKAEAANQDVADQDRRPLPEINEEVFIETPKPNPMDQPDSAPEERPVNNLRTLYVFLERNMEKKGYEDALINPDSSVMEEQAHYLRSEILLYILKVKTYYSNHLRDIEFHIETRKRNGMVETVEELLTRQKSVADEFRTVLTIEDETQENKGISQNLILGYKIGFRNGFAAITYNSILGK